MTTNFYHIGSRYRKKENFLLPNTFEGEKILIKRVKKFGRLRRRWCASKKVTFRSNKSQNRSGQSRNL